MFPLQCSAVNTIRSIHNISKTLDLPFGEGVSTARTTARMRVIPAVVQNIFRSRAERCPPKISRGSGHPRRAGVPEGDLDVDGTGAGYGLRSSCGVGGHAVRE